MQILDPPPCCLTPFHHLTGMCEHVISHGNSCSLCLWSTCSQLPGPSCRHLSGEGGPDLGERRARVRGQGHLPVSQLEIVACYCVFVLLWDPLFPLCRELLEMTCRLGNLLRRRGVKRGDCVTIYMPPCPVAVASMLACARIGAAHSVVFAGFSAEALSERIRDGETVS